VKLILTAISGSREGQLFTIEPGQRMTFGRTGTATVSFEDDGHMSSLHFEVENCVTHAEVRDLGSTNGTWLNNQKIRTEQLRDGDRVRAGKTVLTVELMRIGDMRPINVSPVVEEAADTWVPDKAPSVPRAGESAVLPERGEVPFARNVNPTERGMPWREDSVPTPPIPSLRPSDDPPPKRPNNPFDSVDFSSPSSRVQRLKEVAEASGPGETFAPKSDVPSRDVSNPFDESSVFTPVAASVPAVAEPLPRRAGVGSFQFMARRTKIDAADAMSVVVDSLAQRWSVQVVLHFQKIRSVPPGNSAGKPLFSWLPTAIGSEYSPVRMGWNEVQANPGLLAMMPRLCRADACVAFFGESASGVGQQIDEMLVQGLEPFSEPDGLLPVYWPSCLANILDVHGVRGCGVLFGERIVGAVICSTWHRHYLLAAAAPALAELLAENGFSESSTMSQSLIQRD
jgi:hypothetical protein